MIVTVMMMRMMFMSLSETLKREHYSMGAVGPHGDNLVEKILSVLPQFPGHTSDGMVSMAGLTALQAEDENQNVVAPGCLAQSQCQITEF
ncbi:sec1 family domain-containing protein 2-like [Sorex fumeus]|uniref:sec1 family domain-containing protein 2-like n=1 Tax=Sorex fumeus TaxID=62283 RepID=UPI0024ACE355|nr:sec1 family domain-containing protein 2-like [Sorex fumeus]XP_055981229.1 sec1 family domain-containing protein 2-like [Sorex fumeus]XP_055981836.1 sec1 family domain-containing protein 2-like [Sorex fumeus]XP_055981975.1 sec1 family domain-containing protein 2-like [Sorex fumeus]